MATLYVFVAGPQGAGRSQLLASLGEPDQYWTDEDSQLEFRHLVVDDSLEVYLMCAVDATRFDPLLEITQRDLLGYIIMVDAADPESWGTARIMVANCRGYAPLPTIIAANKQDLPGAHTAEQVGAAIGMESMMKAIPCTATDPDSARAVFLELLYSVQNEIDRLDTLIEELERLSTKDSQG
jgi:uncharacterized protein